MLVKLAIVFFLFISCEKSKSDTVFYELIRVTDSEYAVQKKNVSVDETAGNHYRKLIFENKKIKRIENYNDKNELISTSYTPAIIEFTYSDNDVHFIKRYDKNNKPLADELTESWSVEYIYGNGKIVQETFRDVNNQLMKKPNVDVDYLPAIKKYRYDGNDVWVQKIDENNEPIGDEMSTEQPQVLYAPDIMKDYISLLK